MDGARPIGSPRIPRGIAASILACISRCFGSEVTVYPAATNPSAVELIATLPRVNLTALTNALWWNAKVGTGSNESVALGIGPPGVYVFSDGNHDANGPSMRAVGGGAPSGWSGQSKRVTPLKLQTWHGHYTPSPTIYVRADHLGQQDRLGLRLRDDEGRYWIAEPEPQGAREGIQPFLLKLPPTATNLVPELVLLRPVMAEFLVKTERANALNP